MKEQLKSLLKMSSVKAKVFSTARPLKKTTYFTRQTADTCLYCLQQVKVMSNLSAPTAAYVNNSSESAGGSPSSVKLWMEICRLLVWTEQSRHLRRPWRAQSFGNGQSETNLTALTCQSWCHLRVWSMKTTRRFFFSQLRVSFETFGTLHQMVRHGENLPYDLWQGEQQK